MVINNYFIGGYFINGYFIGGCWWLFYCKSLVVI
jgi:hypothetical protein